MVGSGFFFNQQRPSLLGWRPSLLGWCFQLLRRSVSAITQQTERTKSIFLGRLTDWAPSTSGGAFDLTRNLLEMSSEPNGYLFKDPSLSASETEGLPGTMLE